MRDFLKWFYQHRHEFKIWGASEAIRTSDNPKLCPLQAWTGKEEGYMTESDRLLGATNSSMVVNAADGYTWSNDSRILRTKMERILAMK